MTNTTRIETFYNAFVAGNANGMVACYHDDIIFSDPAFGTLKGAEAKSMWHMLIERGKGANKITYSNVEATETTGSATWTARYPYGPKKRPVVNYVTANFEFKDGLIIAHHDTFNMYAWSKQALGLPGVLLGWTSFMENTIQKKTNALLKKYMKDHTIVS